MTKITDIGSVGGGLLDKMFRAGLDDVIDNLRNPLTDEKAKRAVSVTLEVALTEEGEYTLTCSARTKLAPLSHTYGAHVGLEEEKYSLFADDEAGDDPFALYEAYRAHRDASHDAPPKAKPKGGKDFQLMPGSCSVVGRAGGASIN